MTADSQRINRVKVRFSHSLKKQHECNFKMVKSEAYDKLGHCNHDTDELDAEEEVVCLRAIVTFSKRVTRDLSRLKCKQCNIVIIFLMSDKHCVH